MKRLESVDVLRGGVMAVMALDHVRDFFGAAGNPTDPSTTTVAMFFTRRTRDTSSSPPIL